MSWSFRTNFQGIKSSVVENVHCFQIEQGNIVSGPGFQGLGSDVLLLLQCHSNPTPYICQLTRQVRELLVLKSWNCPCDPSHVCTNFMSSKNKFHGYRQIFPDLPSPLLPVLVRCLQVPTLRRLVVDIDQGVLQPPKRRHLL